MSEAKNESSANGANLQRHVMRKPIFGEWMRGIYASETNPIRDGMYVRTIVRSGRVINPGKFYELTDGKGKFWQYPITSVVFRDDA